MAVSYTVYANIEANDESKRYTNEDDCWHPLEEERDLAVFDSLEKAQEFLESLPTKE